ncbi:hypothetical protein (DUF328 domain) [Campylobacter iguaniorum]|uniref:DUF328 domain protein n=1 Tax=Campylobacter iguaniorum TaxID=1244531 RepID=A0A076F8V0_9BACT|nr:YaaA family protein [Campylobacter iguaniorum]AII14660.1 hypothetical protein (DUF328 domain) [Campylobacter iguaniorum]
MKILFSPSETKIAGGDELKFDKSSLIFPNLYEKRVLALHKFNDFLQNASFDELSKLFGLKKDEEVKYYSNDIFSKPLMKAILRYNGVAYEYLKYRSLDENAQSYIDENTLIFSNLYGSILAKNFIVDYKLKQGENLPDFVFDDFYKQNFSDELDKMLENEDIIDLRAGFYEKFYTIKKPFLTVKFLKNGKVVSHFAKAYRGILLRELAINKVQTIDEFYNLNIKKLKINKIIQKKLRNEIIFDIFE